MHAKEQLAASAQALRDPLEAYASETVSRYFKTDPSPFHWELEFPEVFLDDSGRPRLGGGFDAVVGNPPYVRIQELGRELAELALQPTLRSAVPDRQQLPGRYRGASPPSNSPHVTAALGSDGQRVKNLTRPGPT